MNETKQGFIERFLKAASHHPDSLAIEVEGAPENNATYAELLGQMEVFKGIFEKLDVSENEMVMLILPSGSDFIASLYGVVSSGAVALPLNSRLTQYEMGKIINDSNPVGVVCTANIYQTYKDTFVQSHNFRFALSVDKKITTQEISKQLKPFYLNDFHGVKSDLSPPVGNPVSTCHYTYRGCGYPLGVPHRYQDYTTCVEGMANRYPLDPDDCILIGLPIYPIYGISIMVIFPLSLGCRLVIVPKFMEQNFVDVILKHKIMFACFVPVIIPKLLAELKARSDIEKIDFNPYIVLASSATTLTKELQDKIAQVTGIEVIQGYGLTEALAVTSTYKRTEAERGTIGVPIHDDIDVKVIDTIGNEVAPGKLGEIIIGGPTVTTGFLNKPEDNKKFFKNGYFHTGDLGFIDQNGLLNFEGRALPIAKVAAQMVDLIEVETVVLKHPDVVKAKATEIKVPVGKNYVSLTVKIRKNTDLDQKKLQRFCRGYLSFFKVPAEIKLINIGD